MSGITILHDARSAEVDAPRISPHQVSDMRRVWTIARRLLREEAGATMVEYGIMVAFIAAVCFIAVQAVGTGTQGLFSSVTTAWAAA